MSTQILGKKLLSQPVKFKRITAIKPERIRYILHEIKDTVSIRTKKIEINDNFFDFLPWRQGYASLPKIAEPKSYSKEAKYVSEIFDKQFRVEERLPDGFRMSPSVFDNLESDGRVIFNTEIYCPGEILLVDRSTDKGLNTTIKKFKELIGKHSNCSEYQKVQLLKDFVNGCYKDVRNAWTDLFPQDFVTLGQTVKSGSGICRQRALLTKVLADEIGLKVSLIRGNYRKDGCLGTEPHMWNEVTIDGEKYLLDGILDNFTKITSKASFLDRYYRGELSMSWKQVYV